MAYLLSGVCAIKLEEDDELGQHRARFLKEQQAAQCRVDPGESRGHNALNVIAPFGEEASLLRLGQR